MLENINETAKKACMILQQAGYQSFLVGGCIRDLLLSRLPKDWDITTNAKPMEIIKLFDNTYPTGIEHGTITVIIDDQNFEVTTFRIEGNYSDGRHPDDVSFVQTIEQDLSRRDLTINTMAYDPIKKELIDPYGGVWDLKRKRLKMVGHPESRFREDGLRLMRVARFASQLQYDLDPLTFNAMNVCSNCLTLISKERIKDELCKILLSSDPSYGLKILSQTQLLPLIVPILSQFESSIEDQKNYSGEIETCLAILYHFCPILKVREELINLKFSNKEIKKTCFLLELLPRFVNFYRKHNLSAYRNLLATIKNYSIDSWEETLEQLIILTEAVGYLDGREMMNQFKEVIIFSRKDLCINGDDLQKLGIPMGPKIKRILDQLYVEILHQPAFNNRECLIKMVKLALS